MNIACTGQYKTFLRKRVAHRPGAPARTQDVFCHLQGLWDSGPCSMVRLAAFLSDAKENSVSSYPETSSSDRKLCTRESLSKLSSEPGRQAKFRNI